ncbi:MAG TPA: cytochrome c-type biogenesis protein [Chloroflexota bacterium]
MSAKRLALIILALLLLAWLLATPTAAADDDQLDQQTREIARLLRCPVCQSLSVADSPSELAVGMRALIRKQLAAGQSREQVIAYFVDRYGDEVLLDPPKTGFSQLIWWGAAGIPLAGAAIVVLFVRGRVRTARGPEPAEPSLPGSERRKYEQLLEQELERVGGGERW